MGKRYTRFYILCSPDEPLYTVGQNHVYVKGAPGEDWEMKAMSEWFTEIRKLESHDYNSISEERLIYFIIL